MINKQLLLKVNETLNSYGLVNSQNQNMSLEETLNFFKSIHLNECELMQLNEYVMEEKDNSFYDNPFFCYDENGRPLNFIEGLRFNQSQYKEYLEIESIRTFECHFEDDTWICQITEITEYRGYIKFTVIGKGSSIDAYLGNTGDEIWICFPRHYKGCTLADPNDLYWNCSELSDLFNSIPDGCTVAYAVKQLRSYLNNILEEF